MPLESTYCLWKVLFITSGKYLLPQESTFLFTSRKYLLLALESTSYYLRKVLIITSGKYFFTSRKYLLLLLESTSYYLGKLLIINSGKYFSFYL